MGNRTGGALRVVVTGAESAFNSGMTTPAGYDIPKAACSFGFSQEMAESDELRSDPNPSLPIRGLEAANGDLVEAVEDTGIGVLSKLFMTGYTTPTETVAPYVHTFKFSTTTPPSFCVEVGDTAEGKYDLYYGVLVRSLNVQVTKQAQVLKATWGLTGSGKRTLNGGSAYVTTPTTFTVSRCYMADATVLINGAASVLITDVSFTVERTIEIPQVLDGQRYGGGGGFAAGAYSVKGNFTGLWDASDTLRGYVTSDTEIDLKIKVTRPGAATRYVQFHFPEAKIGHTNAENIASRGLVQMSCEFYGYYQDSAAATAFSIVLANDQSAGY